jgi:hypothetical protein
MAKTASLTAGLLSKKGEAVPVVEKTVALKEEVKTTTGKVQEYFKALTLKLDKNRYLNLKQAGLEEDKSSQDILVQALDEYIEKRKNVRT